MSYTNLKLDVQVETNKSKSEILYAIRKGIYRGLDEYRVATPNHVHVSVDFRDKEQLFYMITDLGKRAEVELFYEEDGNLKKTGRSFMMHSYMLGTEQGCGYIDYEIRCILEEANEEGMYHDSWAEVYESFEDLPPATQVIVSSAIDETMTADEMILALDKINIAADPSLDGSVGLFRFK